MEDVKVERARSEGTIKSAAVESQDSAFADEVAVKSERVKQEVAALGSSDSRHVRQEPNEIIVIGDDDDNGDDEVKITGALNKHDKREEVISAAKRKGAIELDDDDDHNDETSAGLEPKRQKTAAQDCDVCHHSFQKRELRQTYIRQEQEFVCRVCYDGLLALQESKWKKLKETELTQMRERRRGPEIKECTICLERLEAWQFPKPNHSEAYGCATNVCRDCWRDHLESEVNSKDLALVQCPSCEYVLEVDELQILATDETYNLWIDKAAKALVEKDSEYRACPIAECKFQGLFSPDPGYKLFVCPDCRYRFCVACEVPFHNGETCQEYHDRLQREQREKADAAAAASKRAADDHLTQQEVQRSSKPCPKCSMRCEKISGCDHVTCLRPTCRHQFNWSTA